MILILLISYTIFFTSKTKHPMLVCLLLVLTAIQVGMYLNKMLNKWLFYLMILLFLGGMMVLFIYLTSLTNKSKPTFKGINFKHLIFFILLASMLNYLNYMHLMSNNLSLEVSYTFSSSATILFMMSYLLFLLLLCLKLIDKNTGSMKNKFKWV